MVFNQLSAGYQLYLLRKAGRITAEQAKVMSVSTPYMSTNVGVAQMVVDIVAVGDNGNEVRYCVPDSAKVAKASDSLFIYTDINDLIKEVSLIRMQSEGVLKSVSSNEQIVQDCKEIEENFDPVMKAKRENDERMTNLEKTLIEIQKQLKTLSK